MIKLLILIIFPCFFSEIDNEGVVEPDTEEPQPMGDINVEVCNCKLNRFVL
jgi:hypothetical protein